MNNQAGLQIIFSLEGTYALPKTPSWSDKKKIKTGVSGKREHILHQCKRKLHPHPKSMLFHDFEIVLTQSKI